MKKQIYSLIFLLITLLSCNPNPAANNEKLSTFDFSTNDGVKSYIVSTNWSKWGGRLTFKDNGTCNFFKKNLRTEQVEWDFNGTFVVAQSKFEDTGGSYWYVDVNWEKPMIISNIYTIYDGYLVDPVSTVSWDSYGPILNSWQSEHVSSSDKLFPITH